MFRYLRAVNPWAVSGNAGDKGRCIGQVPHRTYACIFVHVCYVRMYIHIYNVGQVPDRKYACIFVNVCYVCRPNVFAVLRIIIVYVCDTIAGLVNTVTVPWFILANGILPLIYKRMCVQVLSRE